MESLHSKREGPVKGSGAETCQGGRDSSGVSRPGGKFGGAHARLTVMRAAKTTFEGYVSSPVEYLFRYFLVQPGLRRIPIAPDGYIRNFQNFGGLINRQAAEIPELDDFSLPFIKRR